MVYITQAALAVVAVLTGSHSTLGLKVQPSQNKLYWNTTGLCNEFTTTQEELDRLTGGCARLEFCTLPGYVYEDGKFGYKMDGGKCLSPGPTMYMTPGMTYGFVLCSEETTDVNHPGTNVHTHGLHISGSGNSDDITRHIYPGSCGFYEYAIPENHMGGSELQSILLQYCVIVFVTLSCVRTLLTNMFTMILNIFLSAHWYHPHLQ